MELIVEILASSCLIVFIFAILAFLAYHLRFSPRAIRTRSIRLQARTDYEGAQRGIESRSFSMSHKIRFATKYYGTGKPNMPLILGLH